MLDVVHTRERTIRVDECWSLLLIIFHLVLVVVLVSSSFSSCASSSSFFPLFHLPPRLSAYTSKIYKSYNNDGGGVYFNTSKKGRLLCDSSCCCLLPVHCWCCISGYWPLPAIVLVAR